MHHLALVAQLIDLSNVMHFNVGAVSESTPLEQTETLGGRLPGTHSLLRPSFSNTVLPWRLLHKAEEQSRWLLPLLLLLVSGRVSAAVVR